MTTSNPTEPASSEISQRILQALKDVPYQKNAEIAKVLEMDVAEVDSVLQRLHKIKVVQDSTYRWSLLDESAPPKPLADKHDKSEVSRIFKYYLESIGQDGDSGVSIPINQTQDYALLDALPVVQRDYEWTNSMRVSSVLARVVQDKRNLEAWIGYPVRIRKNKSFQGETTVAEPLLLWRVLPPSSNSGSFEIEEGLPCVNFAYLKSIAMGSASEVVEEAAGLGAELGLNNPPRDQPSALELISRLQSIRPDWDWVGKMNPQEGSTGAANWDNNESGIYNQAMVVTSKRSPYTLGLESELKELAQTPSIDFMGTALDQWLRGEFFASQEELHESFGTQPLIEVLPMNSEQRAAVQSAMTSVHTVVTGPPGTGKSQVVANILVNAAWRGMKVLFASKNNKAVDVVADRINGLSSRPALLRLGSLEYQTRLANYFTTLLSGQVGPEDIDNYNEKLKRHEELIQRAALLDELEQKTLEARNTTDHLDMEIEDSRALFGEEHFSSLDEDLLNNSYHLVSQFIAAVDAVNPSYANVFERLFAYFGKQRRVNQLITVLHELLGVAESLSVPQLQTDRSVSFEEMRAFAQDVIDRTDAGQAVLSYKAALEALLMTPPFELIAKQRTDVTLQVARNSLGLWKDWVQLVPSRLSTSERKDVADYAAVLQVLNDPHSKSVNPAIRQKSFTLHQKVLSLFSCWAVTSLSVRGKVALEPGYFDLVVIDEAGQSDIASALPLLYRAKRAVIIGDPMQLRHISQLPKHKDIELQQKYGLSQNRASWMYSVNSLYDVAAAVATPGSVINLRDHHRSHADIIEFSNRAFYSDRLRVATKHSNLVQPEGQSAGIVWQECAGEAIRPPEGGLRNPQEAAQIVTELKKLLLEKKFKGTVGVVTPFRSQASLIQSLLSRHNDLKEAAEAAELLVDTAHKFQGDERDVIFFSPVIDTKTPASALSFLKSNPNLFNVAITRARALLHVVGDSQAVRACDVEYLSRFSRYVQQLGFQAEVMAEDANVILDEKYPDVPFPELTSVWEQRFYEELFKAGVRAVPQVQVENHILDLAVYKGNKKLNLEIDSELYHRSWTSEICLREQLRTQRLTELGWEVQRIWVYELRDNLQGCVGRVIHWLKQQKG